METKERALVELGKMDNESRFRETVEMILSREHNWVSPASLSTRLARR